MNKIATAFILFFSFNASSVYAGSCLIMNADEIPAGRVQGVWIYDAQDYPVGYIDGAQVLSSNGEFLGKVEGKEIFDANDIPIGSVVGSLIVNTAETVVGDSNGCTEAESAAGGLTLLLSGPAT